MIRACNPLIMRSFAYVMISAAFLYLINNYLVYWQDLPGSYNLFSHYGWFGLEGDNLDATQLTRGWMQVVGYLVVLAASVGYVVKTGERTLQQDSVRFSRLSAYIIRFAFWSVTLVGSIDMLISFLRIEGLLEYFAGEWLTQQLGRAIFRGTYVHYPLLVVSLFLAAWLPRISFAWLALYCVLAEFLIVVTRFVFSYEQAYMGDVVRFWYAALFLFASAHTLVEEGHVRVDVLYAGFSRRRKAMFDTIGSFVPRHTHLLGHPDARPGWPRQQYQQSAADLRGFAKRLRHVRQVHHGRLSNHLCSFDAGPVRQLYPV